MECCRRRVSLGCIFALCTVGLSVANAGGPSAIVTAALLAARLSLADRAAGGDAVTKSEESGEEIDESVETKWSYVLNELGFTKDEAKKRMHKLLAEYVDTNHDGIIRDAEVDEWLYALHRRILTSEVKERMKTADTNRDAKLSLAEVIQESIENLSESGLQPDEEFVPNVTKRFEQADEDRNGFIENDELLLMANTTDIASVAMVVSYALMTDADGDGDGKLTLAELSVDEGYAELSALVEDSEKPSEASGKSLPQKVFEAIDENEDGYLNQKEMFDAFVKIEEKFNSGETMMAYIKSVVKDLFTSQNDNIAKTEVSVAMPIQTILDDEEMLLQWIWSPVAGMGQVLHFSAEYDFTQSGAETSEGAETMFFGDHSAATEHIEKYVASDPGQVDMVETGDLSDLLQRIMIGDDPFDLDDDDDGEEYDEEDDHEDTDLSTDDVFDFDDGDDEL